MKNIMRRKFEFSKNGFVRTITPYKFGLDFLRNSYVDSKGETINPKDLSKKEIAEYGLELLIEDEEWIEVE